ncbi:YybH family protein [Glycomyces tritici]|uniref:Nuclear transport factor 2 family protein n=1 Tax=Glycomyces tritici TaxID=2665176 RepID=A0ABT7YYA2_9ACTN|nr:nuclear transport factor 2 family protein [Glycomyces tritici]MDN3243626.1 nuclear transport factor 2 family protein [Glycomyces tritici]
MAADGKHANEPEHVTRLVAERLNAGDIDGIAELYEDDAVIAFPPGRTTTGIEAIKALYAGISEQGGKFPTDEEQLPTVHYGGLALTSTISADGKGTRTQVLRRQADGTWKRIIDRPEVR